MKDLIKHLDENYSSIWNEIDEDFIEEEEKEINPQSKNTGFGTCVGLKINDEGEWDYD